MTHSARDPRSGKFVSTRNSDQAGQHDVKGIESMTDLPFEDIAADARGPLDAPRHGPHADEVAGEPVSGSRAVLIDADSGQHLGTVDQDALRQLIGRRSGHLADHVADEENYIVSGN